MNHKETGTQYKYEELYDALVEKMNSGCWKPHDKILPERELCAQYGVSRITVRDTLKRLEEDGYIYRKQGRGTFVAVRQIEQKLTKLYSLREEFAAKGIPHTNRILSFETVTADEALARSLLISPGDRVYKLVRCLYARSQPYTVETSFIPAAVYPGMTRELIREHGLYGSMQTYNIIPQRAVEKLRLVQVSAEDAELLLIKPKESAIQIERTTCSGERCIEYTINIIKGDFFVYTVELK